MPLSLTDLFPDNSKPTFSGHETFALRSNWLKKAYDTLLDIPGLFYRDDAFVILGVGKNMVQSIRHWGRVCGIFDKSTTSERTHKITPLGHQLMSNDGWDPFLVTPTARWLLHWQIASAPHTAFTWFYVFNLLRGGDFTVPELGQSIIDYVEKSGTRPPSQTTIKRDIDCLVNCYCMPDTGNISLAEDSLACPLLSLNLVRSLPGQQFYRLSIGSRANLPIEIVTFATREYMQSLNKRTITFGELAYNPGSPGRVFRLDEDTLLNYVIRINEVEGSDAYYSDQAGIRQIAWPNIDDENITNTLLNQAFDLEARYVA